MIDFNTLVTDLQRLEASGTAGTEEHKHVYPASLHRSGDTLFAAADAGEEDVLLVSAAREVPDGLEVNHTTGREGRNYLLCPFSNRNIHVIRDYFPETSPGRIGGHRPTFGTGDRLGIATPGHIRAMEGRSVSPYFAQQSLRELTLMNRSFQQMVDDASKAVFITGFSRPWGADGDHLKTEEPVREALEAGCTFITMDLSDHLESRYLDASPKEIQNGCSGLDTDYTARVFREYTGTIRLKGGVELHYDEDTTARLALVYGKALEHARSLYEAGLEAGKPFDVEISIDETGTPTTPEAHYFVARELEHLQVPFVSLAPRFIGEFQKGIDYIGNTEDFRNSFRTHAYIAAETGHKISVHSGSDKFSIYPAVADEAGTNIHVKTAGTSWLIALETISRTAPDFFRTLFNTAYEVFPKARTYYVISPDMAEASDITAMDNQQLPQVFENRTDRQVLHVSYGELMKQPELKEKIYTTLRENRIMYSSMVAEHIGKHLSLLGV